MMKNFIILVFLLGLMSACNKGTRTIEIETPQGNLTVELFDSTPQHRDNMVKLAGESYYDGLLFHRVMRGFMMQGGDPNSRGADASARLGSGGPGYQIPAEIGGVHVKGALAAARTGGASNPEKKSSGSQFYIVQGRPVTDATLDAQERKHNFKYTPEQRAEYLKNGGAPFLDGDYTVYGKVVKGMEVIDKVCTVQTQPGDRPTQDIPMKVKLIK